MTNLSRIFKITLCCMLAGALFFCAPMLSNDNAGETVALSLSYSDQILQNMHPSFSLRILGLLDTSEEEDSAYPERWLYPGGQSIGILLRTDGILVVGQSAVIDQEGKSIYPAQKAGIDTGDVITSINNIQVTHDDQLAFLVNQYGSQGKEIKLHIKRENKEMDKTLLPVYCQESESYRIGLYIRDNAGGVGTISFIDSETGQYGALGHMISNQETQEKIDIVKGKLVLANVEGVKKGQGGYPGEKIGRFVNNQALGTIDKNTTAGIYGTFTDKNFLSASPYHQLMATAKPSEIQLGEAQMLTVLNGNKVESFTVTIEKVMPHDSEGKGLVVRVTDPVLLEKTGGIVQGMSGSTLIQNGKIIGAVTHVFINDPTKGYGILIHDMLKQANLLNTEQERQPEGEQQAA